MNLLFVHGFLGSGMNFAPIISRLRPLFPDWHFVNPDLLGHGHKSDLRGQALTLESVADDLLKSWPEGPTIALGHSFGLRPLLKILAKEPERALGLIAEDSSPDISDPGYYDLRRIFTEVPVPYPSRPAAKDSLELIYGKNSRMARFLMTNIREISPGVHSWRFDRTELLCLLNDSKANSLWEEWVAYPAPIAMLVGAESSFLTQDRVDHCVHARPNLATQVIQIAGAGHWVHADQPDLFTSELVKLLKEWT